MMATMRNFARAMAAAKGSAQNKAAMETAARVIMAATEQRIVAEMEARESTS